jgi:hypothetical protein
MTVQSRSENMGRPKITIGRDDYQAWGKLVKTWATGRNYVDYDATEEYPVPTNQEMPPKYPKPKCFAEFWDQCRLANVGLFYDDGNNTPVPRDDGIGLLVLQTDSDVFALRLPPDRLLREAEAKFLASTTYPLPKYYSRIFERDPVPAEMDTKLERMTIHAERVGEYTLNTCG